MSQSQEGFYAGTLKKLLDQGVLSRDHRILIVCAGLHDRDTFSSLGFKHVVLSNLDARFTGHMAPFEWSYQDVENLTFADNEFDFCVVHDGLHHCQSPHKGLLEMHRVARLGIVVFEPRDSWVSRIAVRLNFAQEYETSPVSLDYVHGGLRNGPIPNFVYRWNEREVEKTIRTHSPWGNPRFLYFYALAIPTRLANLNNKLLVLMFKLGLPFLRLIFLVFPKQCNNFAFCAVKPVLPAGLQPWLKLENNEMVADREWYKKRYSTAGSALPPGAS